VALQHDARFKALRNGILRHLVEARTRGGVETPAPDHDPLPSAKASAA
jgi:hypothetical protein